MGSLALPLRGRRTAKSDAEGRFEFTGVSAGEYRVRARQGDRQSKSEPFTLSAGGRANGVRVHLKTRVRLRVTVLSAAGEPVPRVVVSALSTDRSSADARMTGGDGVATLRLEPGEYDLSVNGREDIPRERVRVSVGSAPEITLRAR